MDESKSQGLRDREPLFTLFESSPDAIFIEDMVGNVLDCNPAAAALHGTSRENIIGRNVSELVPPNRRNEVRTLSTGTPPVEFEGWSLTADGKSVPVSIRTSRIVYLGQPAMLLHVRDITERKKFEEELRRANDELELRVQSRTAALARANDILRGEIAERNRAEEARRRLEEEIQAAHRMEAIGRLAGGVAHDFNNLLTVVIGRCEVLIGRISKNHPMRSDLPLIHDAAEKAASVTRQLLAFGRKQVLQPKILNLNAVIGNMDDMLRSLITESVEMTVELEQGLWSIEADRGQIEQVLMNLVVNALDAMPDGGKLRIYTRNLDAERKESTGVDIESGRYVTLAVEDTGSGMDSETLSHVFEPFFTTKEKSKGTGLGLSTVYELAEQAVLLRPEMKVLLMSGYADQISKAGFLQPGLHFIEKPFTSNSLALKIREVLESRTD